MTLQRYLEISWIRPHQTSREEIRDLLAIVDRDIGQSQSLGHLAWAIQQMIGYLTGGANT